MIQLSREIRFALVSPSQPHEDKPSNSWGGWPATHQIVPQLKLRAEVFGLPDRVTGYVCNVAVLDRLLRSIVTEFLIPNFGVGQTVSAETMVGAVAEQFQQRWSLPQTPGRLTLELSDRLSYAIDLEFPNMIELTQQFEFSAAHRLHCPSMSDQENVATFGKCNSLNGHGHNYVVEVTIGNSADHVKAQGAVAPLEEFQSTVKKLVIDRLDHKHLNEDVEYFSEINPSVENISIAIFKWLKGSVGAAELVAVKVYETPKTWAEYRG